MKKQKINNKKATTHIGFMISFVIFILFIFFMFYTLKQVGNTNKNEDYLINKLKENLIEKISRDVTIYNVKVDETMPFGCIEVPGVFSKSNRTIVIVNGSDYLLSSSQYSADNSRIQINLAPQTGNFFTIYYSEEFANASSTMGNPCTQLASDQYTKGILKAGNYIFKSKIKNLADRYNLGENEYNALKSELNIPIENDFGFALKDNSKTTIINADKGTNVTQVAIYTNEYSIIYFDDSTTDLKTELGWLKVVVW